MTRRTVRAALLLSAAIPLLPAVPAFAQDAAGATPEVIGEIVVTATRRSESLSKVAASVTAYGQERLQQQGVKTIDDLQRLTPGVNRVASAGSDNISIRGIASSTGTATTGIYIDDTPIQSRNLGFYYGTSYPAMFDLERVEVLRGPQGTLFGAGSEGGTIRFIAPSPSLTTYSGHARAELSTIQDGGTGYEGGVAAGGPIIQDKLGFRASAFHERRAGWIDMYTGSFTVLDSTGDKLGPASLAFAPSGLSKEDANWTDTTSARLALAWRPIEALTITPSIFYQKNYTYDNVRDFLAAPTASDPDGGKFIELRNVPLIDATHRLTPSFLPDHQQQTEQTTLPALKIDLAVPGVDFVSNTSYLRRKAQRLGDFTQTYETSYAGRKVPVPGDYVPSLYTAKQGSFYQEIRAQSANTDAPLTWVVGGFYSNEQQLQIQTVWPNFLYDLPSVLGAVANGAPFGPGYSAYTNSYGTTYTDGISYNGVLKTRDIQKAVFGQVDYKLTSKLKATIGVRYADISTNLNAFLGGSNSNLTAPKGKACVPSSNPCVPVAVGQYKPGQGPFATSFSSSNTNATETSTTPKLALSYQADPDNLFYASASKGFRPGGAQQVMPGICNAELISFGYVDANGNAASPTSYDSDSVWSYELGAKNRIGKLQVSTSLFYVDWKNIQTSVRIASCNQNVTDNATSGATAKGGDIQFSYRPFQGLQLDAVLAYTEASFKGDVVLAGKTLYGEGTAVPGSPAPFTSTLSARYDFPLTGTMDAFVRGDWIHTTRQRRVGSTDPNSASYVSGLQPVPATNLINVRTGLMFNAVEVNLFVDNFLNAHPDLALSRTKGQALFTNYTFQPRTIGAQVNYRF